MTRLKPLAAVFAAALLTSVIVGPSGPTSTAEAQEIPTDPVDLAFLIIKTVTGVVPPDIEDPVSLVDPLNPACDQLDPAMCMFPFPSDHWTKADGSAPTGRRVDLPLVGMPRNAVELPVQPTEWNRNDGFSPGSMLLTYVPGLDLVRTWHREGLPERYQDQMTDLAQSLDPHAPIVLIDATTGERIPFLSELDQHPDTPADKRTLIIRPAINFPDGHRIVVGMRNLLDGGGGQIPAGKVFAELRDGTHGGDRQAHYDQDIFPTLADAGVAQDSLVLAWDLTIASTPNLAGRVLKMRDETFAALGDTDLEDRVISGSPPGFTIESVEDRDPDDATARVVRGTVEVPNYLNLPPDAEVEIPELGTFPAPGARLVYESPTPGPDDLPIVNPLAPTRDVPFVCSVPRAKASSGSVVPTLYGHGLLGSRDESTGGSTEQLRLAGHMPCSVDWTGMATGDVPNVALVLADVSNFPSLADRSQQGFLEFLLLGRVLAHPDGLATDPAFQENGSPVFDPAALVYDGNSQGGILGGAFAALGVDFDRAVLGVPGMNYSTLLNRSSDWEGAYGEVLYAFYPNKMEQQLVLALLQMLWDRGEMNGYANHMTSDPLPNTPPKQVLLQVAFGDHQVANLSAEVAARTMDAHRISTDLPACRHWAVDQMFGFPANDPSALHPGVLAYFDSGTPTPPNDNVAPIGLGEDPHSDPRKDPLASSQKMTFYETGRVIDPSNGAHAQTQYWPERAGGFLEQVNAQVAGDCLPLPASPSLQAPAGPDENGSGGNGSGGTDTPGDTNTPGGGQGPGSNTAGTSTPGGTLPATGGPLDAGLAGLLLAAALGLRSAARSLRVRRPGPSAH